MTAYLLQKAVPRPVQLTLFEATPRLGGKVLTRSFDKRPARYEAGAAEFYDYSPIDDDPLRQLVRELGLGVCPMSGSSVILGQQVLANQDDITRNLGPQAAAELLEFDRRSRDAISPREFYEADDPDCQPLNRMTGGFNDRLAAIAEPGARAYVETPIHSDLATEPQLTSLSYGLQNYLMNGPAYMQLYCLEGGNEQLPKALADRIQAKFWLEQEVARIGRSGQGRLTVSSHGRAGTRDDEFDAVVVALPLNQLGRISFSGPHLAAAIAAHIRHYHFPAHYLRMTLLFQRPFWRGQLPEAWSMLDQFGGCCLYDESARATESPEGVLGWLLGGSAAVELSPLPDEALIARALDSLPEFLAHGRELFLEGRVHRWIDAVNGMPGGAVSQPLDRRHQPEPEFHPDLYLVGDYLFDSTLNGVLDSADYVSQWIAARLSQPLESKE